MGGNVHGGVSGGLRSQDTTQLNDWTAEEGNSGFVHDGVNWGLGQWNISTDIPWFRCKMITKIHVPAMPHLLRIEGKAIWQFI